MNRLTRKEIEISQLAKDLLWEAYMGGGREGPYPSYAAIALEAKGDFTLCSLRAIQRALDLSEA